MIISSSTLEITNMMTMMTSLVVGRFCTGTNIVLRPFFRYQSLAEEAYHRLRILISNLTLTASARDIGCNLCGALWVHVLFYDTRLVLWRWA